MQLSRYVSEKRINDAMTGQLFCPIIVNGIRFYHNSAVIDTKDCGAGSSSNGVTYTSYGSCYEIKRIQQNDTGNIYYFVQVDLTNWKKLSLVVGTSSNALSVRYAFGITPSRDISGMACGEQLAAKISGAVEAYNWATNQNYMFQYMDISSYTGLYYLYFENIANDNTSSNKAASLFIYNMLLEA